MAWQDLESVATLVVGILIGLTTGIHIGMEAGPKVRAWWYRQVDRLFDRFWPNRKQEPYVDPFSKPCEPGCAAHGPHMGECWREIK
jgi:hypothetical protein